LIPLADIIAAIAQLDGSDCAAVLAAVAARLAMQVASAAVSSDAAPRASGRQEDPRNSDMDLLLVEQAAELLRLKPSYVYELVRHKKLAALRTGKYVRIPRAAVVRFVDSHVDNWVSTVLTVNLHDRTRGKIPAPRDGANSKPARRASRGAQVDGKPMGAGVREDSGSDRETP
jgi:excisionase family DNA binding protein